MTVELIPTDDSAELGNFSLVVELDNQLFRLMFQFNERENRWYFNLYDVNGDLIRGSNKLVVNYPIIRLIMLDNRPPGEFICLDTTSNPQTPGLNELGVNAFLAYVVEDQVS